MVALQLVQRKQQWSDFKPISLKHPTSPKSLPPPDVEEGEQLFNSNRKKSW